LRIIEESACFRPSVYWKVRLPTLVAISAILCINGTRDASSFQLILSGVLAVLAIAGIWFARMRSRMRWLYPVSVVAEVGTCLVAAVHYGLFSLVGLPFAVVLICSFENFCSRRGTGLYLGSLICITLAAGRFLAVEPGSLRGFLPLIAMVSAAGAFALVSSTCRQKLASMVEQIRTDLDRATTEREARSENIVRLYEASRATSQEAEPGGIMDMLAEDARKLVGCESASVAIFIEKDLLASVTKGISNEFKRNLRWRVRKGGMTEWVLSAGKPLLVNDAPNDPRSRESSAVKIGKLGSIMSVPLVAEDEVFGIVYVGDTRTGRFNDHDLMLLTILANHAAASILQTRLRRELRKKLEELEDAHRELIGADRLKAEFISAVTSQMRVPLDAIRTYSQTVLQRMDDTTFMLKKKFLGAVVEEAAKLLNTVNGVIDLSRMEFGEGDLRTEQVEIPEVLKDVCNVLDPCCIDKEIEVMVETPGNVSRACVDKDMIFLLYRNLLEAAIGLARRTTPIRVAIEDDESFLKTTMSFSPSTSTLNMEAAFHAISGREVIPAEAGSLGLTLQVAKNIVLRHGGRIWAETHDRSSWAFVVLFGKARKAVMPSDLMLEIMSSRPELKRMLTLVADMISKVMEVSRCLLFLEDSATGNLMLGASVNYHLAEGSRIVVRKGEGLTGKVYDEGRAIVLNSEQEVADSGIGEILQFERIPCTSVPIRLKGRVVGVLTVSDKNANDAFFEESDSCLLAALGERIGVAFERATSYESARDQFVSAMVAMKSVLEARSAPMSKTDEHTGLVVELGRAMGLDDEDVRLLQYVSRIYDVGMVRVGEGIECETASRRGSGYSRTYRVPGAGQGGNTSSS
jgi:GAF domain-containing protein